MHEYIYFKSYFGEYTLYILYKQILVDSGLFVSRGI